jgi:DNA-binding NarL/FixJ family response regulator
MHSVIQHVTHNGAAHDHSARSGWPAMKARQRTAQGGGRSAEAMAVVNARCTAPPMRILIADGHEIVRLGLRSILEAQAGWTVVAEAADGRDIVSRALASKPDVAILDAAMPVINGIDAARQIRKRAPQIQVLIFAQHDSEALVGQALEAGARGYLLKSDANRQLVSAVMTLAAQRPFYSGFVCAHPRAAALVAPGCRAGARLTPRERGVVQLVAEGHSCREIAATLNLSIKTVESHRSSILRKLDIKTTASIVRYAVRNKLIEA